MSIRASTTAAGHEFLLIVRHGRDPLPSGPRTASMSDEYWKNGKADPVLSANDIWSTAEKLRSVLKDLRTASPWTVEIGEVWYSDPDDERVVWAADLLAAAGALEAAHPMATMPACKVRLGPPVIGPYWSATAGKKLEELRVDLNARFQALADLDKPKNAVVLVGNQPAIDWFLDGQVVGDVAVAAGEIVCLIRNRGAASAEVPRRRWPWHEYNWSLWWSITPSASTKVEALRGKIQSKMTVLSVLAGFTAALLVQILLSLPHSDLGRRLALLATPGLAIATVLFVGALLGYDELMMPSRYWQAKRHKRPRDPLERGPVWRPPSADGSVIYQEAVRLWRWVVRGLVLAGLSLGLLAVAAVTDSRDFVVQGAAIAVVVAAIVTLYWWRQVRPALGSDD